MLGGSASGGYSYPASGGYSKVMRWLAGLIVAAAMAQDYQVPAPARQGDTLHLRAPVAALSARIGGRTIRMFPQSDGVALGLMPIPPNAAPGAYQLQYLDGKSGVLFQAPIVVLNAHFPWQNIALTQELTRLKASPDEEEITEAFRTSVSAKRYWSEPLLVPVESCLTSLYGVARRHNGRPTGAYHGGVDLRGADGAPIRAAAAGVVRIARQFNLHGGTVAIDHGQGLETMYLHMSAFAVKEGAEVQAGDIVGYVGSTGRATGPHLHWTVYVNGVPVNPGQWVTLASCYAERRQAR